jgi:hypothetical protein
VQKRSRWPVDTFDDGTFNLDPDVILPLLRDEPRNTKVVRRVVGAPLTKDIFFGAERHFSIFSRSLALVRPENVVELDFLCRPTGNADRGLVRIMLGTPVAATCSAMRRMDLLEKRSTIYEKILDDVQYDIFLPHPAEYRSSWVAPPFAAFSEAADRLIAEDLIHELIRQGYSPVVYGFSSTTLLTVGRAVRAINLLLPEEPLTAYMKTGPFQTCAISDQREITAIPRF